MDDLVTAFETAKIADCDFYELYIRDDTMYIFSDFMDIVRGSKFCTDYGFTQSTMSICSDVIYESVYACKISDIIAKLRESGFNASLVGVVYDKILTAYINIEI